MNKRLTFLIYFYPLILFCQTNLQDEFSSLINAELSFSNLSERNGIKEAFLTYLDDDAVMFRPYPTNGKELYKKRKEIPGKLIWKPDFADISSSGDFGYTTGPWEFSLDSIKEYGHFVTVWYKADKVDWKVLIDGGISHAPVVLENIPIPEYSKSLIHNTVYDSLNSANEILILDKSISFQENNTDGKKIYLNTIGDIIRFNLPDQLPITNSDSVKNYINKNTNYMTSTPEKSFVSPTGDLGYTYGLIDTKVNSNLLKFSYIRIWKRENKGWALRLEIRNLINEK